MQATPKHLEVAKSFRRLLADYDIPPPDGVEYAADSVIFLWDAPRLAVVVDFDDEGVALVRE
jgi:hypothetical protein